MEQFAATNSTLGKYSKLENETNSLGCAPTVIDSVTDDEDGLEMQEVIPGSSISLSTIETFPNSIKLYKLEYLAIPCCYLMVGMALGIISPLLNVYPIELKASEAQQTTLVSLSSLPSCFKIFFGFLSDNLPIAGYRRKPYMLIGWMITSLSMLYLLLFSNLGLRPTDENFSSNEAPSIPLLGACFFIWAMGLWLADVMGDSLVAELAKLETHNNRGNLQLVCYILKGAGFTLMSPLSSLIYNNSLKGPLIIITIAAALPLTIFPLIYFLHEESMLVPIFTARQQCFELWKTACSRSVWRPMGFLYLFSLAGVPNAAWREFLKTVLTFSSLKLNSLMTINGILAFFGLVFYKFVLKSWSWRHIFLLGIIVNSIFSALQLLLINGHTFGMDPYVFALGDDAVTNFVSGIQYIPMVVLMVSLVPTGIEGTSYALFTTTTNVADALSDAFGTILLGIWDVSKTALARHDLHGLAKLTILTAVIQVLPAFFVHMIPHSLEDLNRAPSNVEGNPSHMNKLGGSIYLAVVFLSIFYSIFIAVMNVVWPGWAGGS